LVCPRCASEMRVLAVITDAAEVTKILRHLIKASRQYKLTVSIPLLEAVRSSSLHETLPALFSRRQALHR